MSSNKSINYDKKILFLHAPKTAGKTVRKFLDMNYKSANHAIPSNLFTKDIWENYYSIMMCRHPIDRFVSSYNYHTQESYTGREYRAFNDIHKWDMETYFNKMRPRSHVLTPLWKYTYHKDSNKMIDCIIRFEHLEDDLRELGKKFSIDKEIPYINPSKKRVTVEDVYSNKKLLKSLYDEYELDFKIFNYEMLK